MLGVPLRADKPRTVNDRIDSFIFAKRARAVTESLENSIFCLVTAMDPELGGMGGKGAKGWIDSLGMRSLIELVGSCEERNRLLVKYARML